MMIWRKASALVPFLACSAALLQAGALDQKNYGIDYWREAEGLPQSRVRAIVQTRDGYLWLGTDHGAVRFNSASFTAFTVETGSLRDNEVWALQEDDESALWMGTYGGGLTRLKDGRFKTFTTADGLADDVVTRIVKDAQGNLWMTTPRGLSRYSHGTFTTFTKADGLSGDNVAAVCTGSAGVVVATPTGVHRLNGRTFETLHGIVDERHGAIGPLTCARDGAVWIGFSNAVIKSWKAGVVTTYALPKTNMPQVTLLHEDPSGAIWAAAGLKLYKLEGGAFQPVVLEDGRSELGVVYSMHSDREGSIWIGFQSNGLGRLRVNQISVLSAFDGLPNDSARSVFQDHRGNIWIGTASGFAKYSGRHVVSYTELEGRRLGAVRSIAEDERGRIWLGAGAALLLMENGRLVRFPGWTDTSEIEVIYRAPGGAMWVGTDGDGLYEFQGNRFRNYRTQDGLAGNQVRALLADRHNALWVSTFGDGVSRYAGGVFTTFNTAQGLAGNRVSTIHEDEDGTLWFATRNGLSRFQDGKFFSYYWNSGLLVNFLYTILDDGRGNFWFSCAQGLVRVSKSALREYAEGKIKHITSVSYGVRDGMKTRAGNVGNQPAAWKTADGTLLFSTLKGVVVVAPGRIQSSSFVPPVYIESVRVNKQVQPLNREPRLPLGGGEFEIDYAALSYLDPEKMRFKYRLEGFDPDWVDAGSRRFAYYANLPPGQYRFQVAAGNVDGPWNEAGASFSFILSPRFYQTRLFLLLALTGVIVLIWLLYRLRLHELKARYSAVLAERNRISQDIHDTFAQNLAGIALQLDSVTMQLEEIPPGLRERLDEACNLTRYSLAEARRAVADLRSDELDRAELPAALPQIAERMAAGAAAQTSVRVIGTPQRLSPLMEKNVLRIFQEAMANALKHAHARVIDIELRYEHERLALRVRDDGRGFDAGRVIPLGVGHYGLTGMRERAERIGGCFTLKSAPGQGTELLIEVPFAG